MLCTSIIHPYILNHTIQRISNEVCTLYVIIFQGYEVVIISKVNVLYWWDVPWHIKKEGSHERAQPKKHGGLKN